MVTQVYLSVATWMKMDQGCNIRTTKFITHRQYGNGEQAKMHNVWWANNAKDYSVIVYCWFGTQSIKEISDTKVTNDTREIIHIMHIYYETWGLMSTHNANHNNDT